MRWWTIRPWVLPLTRVLPLSGHGLSTGWRGTVHAAIVHWRLPRGLTRWGRGVVAVRRRTTWLLLRRSRWATGHWLPSRRWHRAIHAWWMPLHWTVCMLSLSLLTIRWPLLRWPLWVTLRPARTHLWRRLPIAWMTQGWSLVLHWMWWLLRWPRISWRSTLWRRTTGWH